MAGTLVISTLSDGTNSTSSTNCIQGSAKAWVHFNGTTSPGTILASYNVTSVTKTATGQYTANFTNAFSDANYAYALSRRDESGQGGYGLVILKSSTTAQTASAFSFFTQGATSFYDCSSISCSFFR